MTLVFKSNNELKYISYGLPNFTYIRDKISEKLTSHEYEELFLRCKKNIPEAIAEAKTLINQMLQVLINTEYSKEKMKAMTDEFYYEVIGLGAIHEVFYNRKEKTDLFIDRYDYIYYKNKKNEYVDTDIRFKDEEHLLFTLNKLLDPVGENLSKTNLSVECALEDTTRFSGLHKLLTGTTSASFRFHNETIFTEEELIKFGTISEQIAWFYRILAIVGWRFIIFGEMGSGKTSTLGSMIAMHPNNIRKALIADTKEWFFTEKFPRNKVIEITTREKGASKFTSYDALVKVLRHQINRIFYNEIRDGTLLNVFEAWQTGHSGGSGMHGGSIGEAWNNILIRLKRGDKDLTDEFAAQIAENSIDILIQCEEIGEKKVNTNIYQLVGYEGTKPKVEALFSYDYDNEKHICHLDKISNKLLEKCRKQKIDFFEEMRKSKLFDEVRGA